MSKINSTPSFVALLNEGISGMVHATVRDLCAAHVGKHTQERIRKVMY